MNDRENYYQQHWCCPQCGGKTIERTLAAFLPMQGQPYRDRDRTRATCNACGWTGMVDDMVPEGTPAVVTSDKLKESAGPQRKEEPEEEEAIDSLVRRLKQRQQTLEESRSRCRREEYRHLAHMYRALLAKRMSFLDLDATKLALRIAGQIKAMGEQTPAGEELAELRILCGTRHAVPEQLAALYVALHGKLEYGVAPVAEHPSVQVQVRCATCGKVADMSRELGGSVPVPPDGWGIVPSVDGILCPECLTAERRLQQP